MATLEDKILGERSEYYCSSSSDDETETENVMSESSIPKASKWEGMSCNTGPKGVLRVRFFIHFISKLLFKINILLKINLIFPTLVRLISTFGKAGTLKLT